MTEAAVSSPDLFPVGDFAGSGFDDGHFFDGQSGPYLDDPFGCASETFVDGMDDWDKVSVNFAGSVLDGLHVFSPGEYQTTLDRAWHSLEPQSQLKLPWESGVWKHIFENTERSSGLTLPVLSRPAVAPLPDVLPVQYPAAKSRRIAIEPQAWQQVVMASDVASWQEMHEAKFDIALKRWFDVVIMFPTTYLLVAQLAEMPTLGEQMSMMRDVLTGRSPLTLLKRVNSITRYMTFLRSHGITAPGVESDLYAFLKEQRSEGAPPSRLAAVIESLRFMEHVVGLSGLTELLSKRCLGAAKQNKAGPNRQAAPLTVAELQVLHDVLASKEGDIWDRNMAGAFLGCVYTRSRWSDFQHSSAIFPDPDPHCPEFVELSIAEYKTKYANAWRGGLLAAVAPAVGISLENWAHNWLEVRALLQAPLQEDFPIMPAPNTAGEATKRPLTTKEVAEWIKLLLRRGGIAMGDRRISSHSAKATILSFLAKYGAELSVREILGAHVSHLQSVIRYSRDALAGPLRVMARMLADIRSGVFMPDATRSGYFAPIPEPAAQEEDNAVLLISDDEEVKIEEELAETVPDDDSEDSADTSSSSDESAVATARCSRPVTVPKAPEGFKMYQHSKSRMLHLMQLDHNRVFQCGRMAGDKHEVSQAGKLRWDTPCCGRCWRTAGQPLGSRIG